MSESREEMLHSTAKAREQVMYAYKCTFTDNTSGQGGALYNVGSSELIECTFVTVKANGV